MLFLYILTSANLNKINEFKWMNKQTCRPIVIFFRPICFYICNEPLVTFTSLKMGVSTNIHKHPQDKVETKSTLFL